MEKLTKLAKVIGTLAGVSNTLCAPYRGKPFPAAMVENPAVPGRVFSVRISARKTPTSKRA